MQNTIYGLEDLFAINVFRIPQYQRAYAWDPEPQLEAFLDDLRQQVAAQRRSPKKQYFLGTLLLHEEDIGGRSMVSVVDGQQRMTTAVVFVATALSLEASGKLSFLRENVELLRRHFIFDKDSGAQKFHTIAEDESVFRASVLRVVTGVVECDSPSSRRLVQAAEFFASRVAAEEWEEMLFALRTARVMVYSVDSAEAATQIFELQNDRGKPLTNLEALKSFLMHCVYLHSDSEYVANERLAVLQQQFARIFRSVEALSERREAPSEDQLLSYHCAAFAPWREAADYENPKRYVKQTTKQFESGDVLDWIEEFIASLVGSYRSLCDMLSRRDELAELSELLLLDRMASFWPLLLKAWNCDSSEEKSNFRRVCRLLEVFAFRGYAIASLRADTGASTLYRLAREFAGDFAALCGRLAELSSEYDLLRRFSDGLDNANFYFSEGRDALYLLWRYENQLRNQTGRKQPPLSWRDVVAPVSAGAKLSIEHVAAQDNPIVKTEVVWGDDAARPFAEVALHRLGNLVIDSVSPNSAKGKKDFAAKLQSLNDSSYLSQGELLSFVPDPMCPEWSVAAVRARHVHLKEFALSTWSADRWLR